MDEFKELSPLFDTDIKEAILPETCVRNRNSLGGTSYAQVTRQLKAAAGLMASEQKLIGEHAAKQIQVK